MVVRVPKRKDRLVSGRVPVMRETSYDRASSLGLSVIVLLVGLTLLLIAIWLSNFLPTVHVERVVMTAGTGGFEDGAEDETLDVESPEDLSDDPSLANDQQETQLEEVVDNMVSVSATAASFRLPAAFPDDASGGLPGSAVGTGSRPLGSGGGRTGGTPEHKRWVIEFAENRSLNLYAQQLDFFGIELAAAFPDGRIVYVKNLSGDVQVREGTLSDEDQRIYFNWQGAAERAQADRELLTRAGIPNLDQARILHFYPPETEQMLLRLEQEYADRPVERIRRTNFRVEGEPGNFRFVVRSQKYR